MHLLNNFIISELTPRSAGNHFKFSFPIVSAKFSQPVTQIFSQAELVPLIFNDEQLLECSLFQWYFSMTSKLSLYMTKSFNLDLNLKNACQLEMSTEPLYDKSLCATQTKDSI